MSTPGFDPAVAASATSAQRAAADPAKTVFVRANAGSGKTRVLVDRVARLLLEGVKPEHILCVTFTKAAAGEMQTRLFRKLGDWSVMGDEKLQAELKELTGEEADADPARLAEARKLFARALETPGGLKVQTLHAFCDSLLRQFPLEAGLPPGFATQEDAQSARARREAELAVYRAARGRGGEALAAAIDAITVRAGPTGFEAIFKAATKHRHHLSALFEKAQGEEPLIREAARLLGVEAGISPEAVVREAMQAVDVRSLAQCAEALRANPQTKDQIRADRLFAVLDALSEGRLEAAYETYRGFFFDSKRQIHKTFFNDASGKACAELHTLFGTDEPRGSEIVRMKQVFAKATAARLHALTAASLTLARGFLAAYEQRLARERAVDFADLVVRAARLLKDSEWADWVRYKLDGGLEHILVDEAQDTAPEQWDVIDALAAEFFAGQGRERGSSLDRTVFCVGDEKQSIYAFQNADPARFIEQGDALKKLAGGAGLGFAEPGLNVSFRSAPEVLEAVDLAFEDLRAALETKAFLEAEHKKFVDEGKAVPPLVPVKLPFAAYAGHEAARRGTPGCVEIWPITPALPKGEEDSLDEEDEADGPVDIHQTRRNSPRNQLAEAVAEEIADIIDRGDAVWEETKEGWKQRAARAGDIVILVRKRDGLFAEIIRQLKLKKVPVAGADRMVLPDQLVVEDMLSLARFALQPGDDLALAELLKSPAFHPVGVKTPPIDEEALFRLAYKRKGTLWEALQRSDDPALADAKAALSRVRARVDTLTPYAFFARFLGEASDTGESRAARIYARLREEARDPLEEFLSRALAHEREGAPSLARFIDEVTRANSELKRDPEGGRNEVRVMTVHAAKGLEAPIVFLPGTTAPPSGRQDFLLAHETCGLLWSEKDEFAPELITALREVEKKVQDDESLRLLYVAMTRARDRLVICGAQHGRTKIPDETTWYGRLRDAWKGEDWRDVPTAIDKIADKYEWENVTPARRYGAELEAATKKTKDEGSQQAEPVWLRTPAPAEAVPVRPLAPSRLLAGLEAGGEPSGLSPLADGGRARFLRGTLVHKLLQILPELPQSAREEAAMSFLRRQHDLDDALHEAIAAEALSILTHPDFAPLFAPGSRAEVSIAGTAPGLPAGVRVSGQIDRLVVTAHEVLVVDFKTNRPPPDSVAQVAPVYLAQMGAYRALLMTLYPGRKVRCALVWTDQARLMELPDSAMQQALELAGKSRALDHGSAAS